MKEYVIKLAGRVDTGGNKVNITPLPFSAGLTQVISAYGSNISIVQVDYEVRQTYGSPVEEVPYPAVYANFGELEDSIPLKNGVAYTPETKFEKVQFNLKVYDGSLVNNPGVHSWEVKATIRILIGDGKYEQFATDAALNALEAIAQLQLKTAGGEYLGSHYQSSHQNRLESSYQIDIQPEDIPEGTNYAILEFQQLDKATSSGFIFTKDNENYLPAIILDGIVSQDNGAKQLARVELIKVNRLLDANYEVLSQQLEYNRAKVSFDVDPSQHLAILQTAHHKYKWYSNDNNSHGFASWKIEYYHR